MVRIDLEPPTPRDPFYRRPARDLSLVRRADPVRFRCETRLARSPPPLASHLCGGLRRDGSTRAEAARSQARPRCVRALSPGHLRAAPCSQGTRHVGSNAREGVRAASLALGTRPQGSPDRRWHARPFESADALRSVSSRQERCRAQRASGETPGTRPSNGVAPLNIDGPQVEFSVDLRRAPVEAARNRPGESEESVDDTVFKARHAREQGVVRV